MNIVVTVPKALWVDWVLEGDAPGLEWTGTDYHFWIARRGLPAIRAGERVYIVSHGRLRGYAPLVRLEPQCSIRPDRACLLRRGDAVACTIDAPIPGFRGWKYAWWSPTIEHSFENWMWEGVET